MPSEPAAVVRELPLINMPPPGARDPRPGLSGVPSDHLAGWFIERGQPAYRQRQLSDHLWSGAAQSVEEMHTLPASLRTNLETEFRVSTLGETEISAADNGLTQ